MPPCQFTTEICTVGSFGAKIPQVPTSYMKVNSSYNIYLWKNVMEIFVWRGTIDSNCTVQTKCTDQPVWVLLTEFSFWVKQSGGGSEDSPDGQSRD